MFTQRMRAPGILVILILSGLSACNNPKKRLADFIEPHVADQVTIRKFVDKSGKDYLLAWQIECDENIFDRLQTDTYEIPDEEKSLKSELQNMLDTSIPSCAVRKRCIETNCTIFFRTSPTTGYILAYKSR